MRGREEEKLWAKKEKEVVRKGVTQLRDFSKHYFHPLSDVFYALMINNVL
jgi:hypothetical protein